MEKTIDCLIIGHNEMEFTEYQKTIKKMGINSGAYRDLNLNFIRYNEKSYTISEILNIFYNQDKDTSDSIKAFHVSESFSAAIAYLGTYLHRRGFTFDYVNSFQYFRAELADKLKKENILTIAITTTLYVSELPILEMIEFIKTYNQTARIIVGGPFVSTRCRNMEADELEYLFKTTIAADFYVNSSQGEAALVKIIDALKNNLSFNNINNIYYNTGKEMKSTPMLQEDNKLSENMVNWDLFQYNAGEYVNVRTAISCPFYCSFCGFPQHAGKYQTAGVEEVEVELKLLHRVEILKSIHFIDDTFNIPQDRFKRILRMMIKNKFQFRWHSYFRCQYTDREMVELMAESGCEGVFLGIESGNNQILKNMNKAVTIDHYLKGIALLKEYDIVTYGNFIIGFPGETDETVQDTINFIEKSGLDFFRAQLWYCEPITPIWEEKDAYNIKGESFQWSHATMDTERACHFIENIFFTIKGPTWVPQYNFDFDGVWHLIHRGFSLQQAKNFLNSFNAAIKEKLMEPSYREVSYQVLKQIQQACRISNNHIDNTAAPEENTLNDSFSAVFDF